MPNRDTSSVLTDARQRQRRRRVRLDAALGAPKRGEGRVGRQGAGISGSWGDLGVGI